MPSVVKKELPDAGVVKNAAPSACGVVKSKLNPPPKAVVNLKHTVTLEK